MKIPIILFIFILGLGPISAQNSFGETTGALGIEGSVATGATIAAAIRPTAAQTHTTIEVFMQVEVRNANGQLVAYVEGPPDILDLVTTLDWVEPMAKKSTIIKDGAVRELEQFTQQFNFSNFDAPSAYYLTLPKGDTISTVFWYNHDSIPVIPGDTFRVFWTIIR